MITYTEMPKEGCFAGLPWPGEQEEGKQDSIPVDGLMDRRISGRLVLHFRLNQNRRNLDDLLGE